MRADSLISLGGVIVAVTFQFLPRNAAASDQASDPCMSSSACAALYEEGLAASDQGRYQEALAALQDAYESTPMPWLLINIGRAQYRLGMAEQAIASFQMYKRLVPNPPAEEALRLRTFIAEAQLHQLTRAAHTSQESQQLAGALTKQQPSPEERRPRMREKLLIVAGSTALGLAVAFLGIGAAGFAVETPCSNAPSTGQAECFGIYGNDSLGTSLGPVIGSTALSTLGVGLLIASGRSWSSIRPMHKASSKSHTTAQTTTAEH